MNCITCGAVVVDKWKFAHPHRKRKYCSMVCRFKLGRPNISGNKHWNWQNKKLIMRCNLCDKEFFNYKSNKKNYSKTFCSRFCANKWKGRFHATPRLELMRKRSAYMKFKKEVLERDGHKCVKCGVSKNLQVDHIKPYALFPRLRMSVNNGRTLCIDCHRKTDTYGIKSIYQDKL